MTSPETTPYDQNLYTRGQDWDLHPVNKCNLLDRTYKSEEQGTS